MSSLHSEEFDIIVASEALHHTGSLDSLFLRTTALLTHGGMFSFSIDIFDSAATAPLVHSGPSVSSASSASSVSSVEGESVPHSSDQTTVSECESNTQPPAPTTTPPTNIGVSETVSESVSESVSETVSAPRNRSTTAKKKRRGKKSSGKSSFPTASHTHSTTAPATTQEQYFLYPLTNTFVHDIKYFHALLERHSLTVRHLEAVETPVSSASAAHLAEESECASECAGECASECASVGEDLTTLPAIHSYIFVLQATAPLPQSTVGG